MDYSRHRNHLLNFCVVTLLFWISLWQIFCFYIDLSKLDQRKYKEIFHQRPQDFPAGPKFYAYERLSDVDYTI